MCKTNIIKYIKITLSLIKIMKFGNIKSIVLADEQQNLLAYLKVQNKNVGTFDLAEALLEEVKNILKSKKGLCW
jgi:hypothetical protein